MSDKQGGVQVDWPTYSAKLGALSTEVKIKDSSGLTTHQMNTLYRVGYGHYCASHYHEALIIFRYLSLLNHGNYSYLLGLGAVLKELCRYDQAIMILEHAERISDDVRASLCKAACLVEQRKTKDAAVLLKKIEVRLSKVDQKSSLVRQLGQLKTFITD